MDRPWGSRGQLRLFLRHGLERLESVEDYLLPRFIDGNPISKYVTFAVLFVEPSMATQWDGALMPSMIDTYDLKLFYTLCTYYSIKWFLLKRIKHSLAVIRENPIPRLALHCMIGPGSYNSFIFLYLALRCLFYALVFLGGNPFRVIWRGTLIYLTLKQILITVLVLTPVPWLTWSLLFWPKLWVPLFLHGQVVVLVLQIYIHRILVYSWNDIRKALYPYIYF